MDGKFSIDNAFEELNESGEEEFVRGDYTSEYLNKDLSTLEDEEIEVYNKRGWAKALFSREDFRLLNESYSQLDSKINSKKSNVLSDGTRIVEVNNKIVNIGGTFAEPEIYTVIAINAHNEVTAEFYKEVLIDNEKVRRYDRYECQDYWRLFESHFEKETIRVYISDDFKYFKKGTNRGQKAVLPSDFRNYGYTKQQQDRGRNGAEAQGTGAKYSLNDENSNRQTAQSLDGKFSIDNAFEDLNESGEEEFVRVDYTSEYLNKDLSTLEYEKRY